jgi:hypothetical protein
MTEIGLPVLDRPRLQGLRVILSYPSGTVGITVVLLFVLITLLAPLIAPYGPFEVVYEEGALGGPALAAHVAQLVRHHQPGHGRAQPACLGPRASRSSSLLSALGSVLLGTLIGLVSGYFGGWVDEVLMPRLTYFSASRSCPSPWWWSRSRSRAWRSSSCSSSSSSAHHGAGDPFAGASSDAALRLPPGPPAPDPPRSSSGHIAPNVLPLSFYIAIGVQTA